MKRNPPVSAEPVISIDYEELFDIIGTKEHSDLVAYLRVQERIAQAPQLWHPAGEPESIWTEKLEHRDFTREGGWGPFGLRTMKEATRRICDQARVRRVKDGRRYRYQLLSRHNHDPPENSLNGARAPDATKAARTGRLLGMRLKIKRIASLGKHCNTKSGKSATCCINASCCINAAGCTLGSDALESEGTNDGALTGVHTVGDP